LFDPSKIGPKKPETMSAVIGVIEPTGIDPAPPIHPKNRAVK
jgi:hypothetical protein